MKTKGRNKMTRLKRKYEVADEHRQTSSNKKSEASIKWKTVHWNDSRQKHNTQLRVLTSLNDSKGHIHVSQCVISLYSRRLFIFCSPKITEGGLIWPCCSSPFPKRERCVSFTHVDARSTVVVASQTRLDGPQTDLCRRPWTPHFLFFSSSCCFELSQTILCSLHHSPSDLREAFPEFFKWSHVNLSFSSFFLSTLCDVLWSQVIPFPFNTL